MVQKLHICEKVYFDQLLDFPILLLLFLQTFLFSHILFTLWMPDFFNTIKVSNSLDPDQVRLFVGPDLGPNCSQRLSADNKINVSPSGQRVKYKTTWYYFLAKTLAKVNFIWLQLFPFGWSVGYNKFWARVSPERHVHISGLILNQGVIVSTTFLF